MIKTANYQQQKSVLVLKTALNLEGKLELEQANTLIFTDEETGVKEIRDLPTVSQQVEGGQVSDPGFFPPNLFGFFLLEYEAA